MNIETTLTGIHSRSEDTVKVSRDFDRARAKKEDLDETFEEDARKLMELQSKSGFTCISDGQLKWQDFLRPFSERLTGLKSGADLSRWFDTNSFYRKPSVVKKIKAPADPEFLQQYEDIRAFETLRKNGVKKKMCLPGPYTLASLVEDEHYDSKKELVSDFAKALRKVIKGLSADGFESVQINEPALVYRYGESGVTSKKELKGFLSAYKDYLSSPPLEVYLHTYFGDCSKILEDLLDLEGVTAIGIDFTQTSLEAIKGHRFKDKALGCGCIDGRNSLVESSEWIADFCSEAVKALKPSGLVILPSCELKYLPRTYADEKIRAIGKAAEILRSKDDHSNKD